MTGFKRTFGLMILSMAILVCPAPAAEQFQNAPDANSQVPFGAPSESRYAVVHLHTTSQCVGYLYVSPTHIRFEAVQPASDKSHSVDLSRSDITAIQPWILLGTPLNAVELKTAKNNYHFMLLPDTVDPAKTSPRQWSMTNVQPAATLLAAISGQPGGAVPGAPAGVASSTPYPGQYPAYPATAAPNGAPVAGNPYPAQYPAYPATAAPNGAPVAGNPYPAQYPAYPATTAPNGAPVTGNPYPAQYPAYPATAAPNGAPVAGNPYPAQYPAYPATTAPNGAPVTGNPYPAQYPAYPATAAPNGAPVAGNPYPAQYPAYPAAAAPNGAPVTGNPYPAQYPAYPAAAAPNGAPVTGNPYPAQYPAYPATAAPNDAPVAGNPYPAQYPANPAQAAPNDVSVAGTPYPAPFSQYPAAGGVPTSVATNIGGPVAGAPYPGPNPTYPAAAGVPPVVPNLVGPNSLSEYVFNAPQGWSTASYPDGIVLSAPGSNTGENCLISMWPMRAAGADIQADANRAFQEIYSTYELRNRTSDGMALPETLIRGSSGQGWDYLMIKRGIGKPSNPPGKWETLQGFVMVARLGGNLAVVSGLSKVPLVSGCFGELLRNVWPRYYYSLHFRSWTAVNQGPATAVRLAGVWITASGTAADRFQFDANGRYASAAAVQNYNRISSTAVLQTTQGFFGNGSYAINENTITLTPDPGNGNPETGLFRVESESHDGGRTWADVLYLLRRSAVDGSEYEVRYSKN